MPDPNDELDDLHGTGPQGNVAGSLASAVGGIATNAYNWYQQQPSWADKAHENSIRQQQILEQGGGLKELIAGTGEDTADLAGGFVGGTKLGKATGIKAYHVSTSDFDRFNSKYIGSGEGTADEGHGFYFTTSPRVVKMYQREAPHWDYDEEEPTFKDKTGKLLGTDDILKKLDTPKLHSQSPEKYTDSSKALYEVIDSLGDGTKLPNSVDHAPFVNKIKELGIEAVPPPKPKTYEVSIKANPDDFLHYNKPLVDQTPSVRQKLAPLVDKHDLFPLDTGAEVYDTIGKGDDVKASAVLKKAGIPGITYRDPDVGSRIKNYVVFHDKIIKILRKYGMAGLVAGGSSHFSTSQTDEDPWATQQ